MTILAFGSAKGSPGVTTTVLALAARWPAHREPLVVEADPAGGDLVPRLTSLDGAGDGLRDTPSTVQLAASARSGLSDHAVLEHLQRLPGPGEVRALVAPPSPFAASTAVAALVASGFGDRLRGLAGLDSLLDVGRIDAASPSLTLVRWLGAVVLVTRPTLVDVLHTRELAGSLRSVGVRCSLVVIGDRPYTPVEAADAIGNVSLVGVLPDDTVGARALCGDARSPKVLGRTRLVRAAAELAQRLAPSNVPSVAPSEAVPFQPPPAPPIPVPPGVAMTTASASLPHAEAAR